MAVIDAAALATATGLSSAVATRLRAVCLPIIEQYASDAPDEIQSEALIRMSSYLDSSRAGLALREMKVLDVITFEFRGAGSALRLSGAAALMIPWRNFTVGRCEATE